MKFYCTKYWATKGIIEFEGTVVNGRDTASPLDRTYASETSTRFNHLFLTIGKDAFVYLCEAEADVEKKARRNLHSKELAVRRAKELLDCVVGHSIKVVKR